MKTILRLGHLPSSTIPLVKIKEDGLVSRYDTRLDDMIKSILLTDTNGKKNTLPLR